MKKKKKIGQLTIALTDFRQQWLARRTIQKNQNYLIRSSLTFWVQSKFAICKIATLNEFGNKSIYNCFFSMMDFHSEFQDMYQHIYSEKKNSNLD